MNTKTNIIPGRDLKHPFAGQEHDEVSLQPFSVTITAYVPETIGTNSESVAPAISIFVLQSIHLKCCSIRGNCKFD